MVDKDETVRWLLEIETKKALAQLRKLRKEIDNTAGRNGI